MIRTNRILTELRSYETQPGQITWAGGLALSALGYTVLAAEALQAGTQLLLHDQVEVNIGRAILAGASIGLGKAYRNAVAPRVENVFKND